MVNNEVKKGDVIVVWFSCGAASTVALKQVIDKYGHIADIRVCNNPVAEEDEDNRRFLRDVEAWFGITIESVTNPLHSHCSAMEVWAEGWMSSPIGASCTLQLKRKPRFRYEMLNHIDWQVLGYVQGEEDRFAQFQKHRPLQALDVLICDGITKADCYQIVQAMGIDLPRVYKMGLPNANCIGCCKTASPTYWNLIRKLYPDVFQQRAEQSRLIGSKLVRCHPRFLPFCRNIKGIWYDERTGESLHKKGKLVSPRIFLDELPEDAEGAPLKNMDFECGIFCWSEK